MSISARLKEERQRLGLTQTALAELAGMTKSAQIKWERGTSAPTAAALSAFAEAGADVLYILTGRRTATERPHIAATQIEDDLDKVRRNLLKPGRLPDDTDEEAERRAVEGARARLRAMLSYDKAFLTPQLAEQVESLLDIAENPASLSLFRAAEYSQMRRRRQDMRTRIASWFDADHYVPSDTVLNLTVALAVEYGVPHNRLVELVHEVFDDARRWGAPTAADA